MLYSPGAEDPRTWETTLVQDLASRGYLMVTIDHTYNASEVEFPGGGVVDTLWPEWFQQAQQGGFPELAKKLLAVRLADTRFVLDELAALDAGAPPRRGTAAAAARPGRCAGPAPCRHVRRVPRRDHHTPGDVRGPADQGRHRHRRHGGVALHPRPHQVAATTTCSTARRPAIPNSPSSGRPDPIRPSTGQRTRVASLERVF